MTRSKSLRSIHIQRLMLKAKKNSP
jgi:hypothetical protein